MVDYSLLFFFDLANNITLECQIFQQAFPHYVPEEFKHFFSNSKKLNIHSFSDKSSFIPFSRKLPVHSIISIFLFCCFKSLLLITLFNIHRYIETTILHKTPLLFSISLTKFSCSLILCLTSGRHDL